MIILTNNPKIKELNLEEILYKEEGYIKILESARNLRHNNYEMLSHPLYSSIKPNETPYRTIILKHRNELDINSLLLIEQAIFTANKFIINDKSKTYNKEVLEDFQIVDLNIIENIINKL